jgi:hypothetical protein
MAHSKTYFPLIYTKRLLKYGELPMDYKKLKQDVRWSRCYGCMENKIFCVSLRFDMLKRTTFTCSTRPILWTIKAKMEYVLLRYLNDSCTECITKSVPIMALLPIVHYNSYTLNITRNRPTNFSVCERWFSFKFLTERFAKGHAILDCA